MRNKARCKNCGDVIESITRHDWVCCRCFPDKRDTGIFVDGGQDYPRAGGNPEHFERLEDEGNP